MKTLKTIITATVMLFALTSSQQTQAQTKEETLEWLKINGVRLLHATEAYDNFTGEFVDEGKYGRNSFRFKFFISNIDENGFIYNHDMYEGFETEATRSRAHNIPFKAILYENVETLSFEPHSIVLSGKLYRYYIRFNKDFKQDDEGFYIFFDKNKEEDTKRVLKAIMHMAKLSGAKENKQIF